MSKAKALTKPRAGRPVAPSPRKSARQPRWGFITVGRLNTLLSNRLGSRWLKDSPTSVYLGDDKYYCPPLNEALALIHSSHGEFLKWTDEVFDCDDFAFVLKAHFCNNAFHNGRRKWPYCFGIVWKNKPIQHAMNWIVYRDRDAATGGGGKLVFALVEPQNVDKPDRPVIRPLDKTDGDFYFVAG